MSLTEFISFFLGFCKNNSIFDTKSNGNNSGIIFLVFYFLVSWGHFLIFTGKLFQILSGRRFLRNHEYVFNTGASNSLKYGDCYLNESFMTAISHRYEIPSKGLRKKTPTSFRPLSFKEKKITSADQVFGRFAPFRRTSRRIILEKHAKFLVTSLSQKGQSTHSSHEMIRTGANFRYIVQKDITHFSHHLENQILEKYASFLVASLIYKG